MELLLTRALATIVLTTVACVLFTAEVKAHPAWGIAVDHQGQIYFSDLENIWKIDTQGRLSIFRAGESGRHTHELNTDEAGNIYGADNSYDPITQRFFSAVWRLTTTGNFSYILAPTDDPPEGTSIWRDRGGNMYHVTNYPERELLVLRRTPNGNVAALVGSSDVVRDYRQGVPYSIGGMAFGADGALYFVHGANVSKLAIDGTMTALARNLVMESVSGHLAAENSPTQLFGIAVDAEGNVFVADYGNRRVLKIAPNCQMTTVIRAEEPWIPTGVAVREGKLYILEHGHTPTHTPVGTRVRKFEPDGRVALLASTGENRMPSGNSSGENSGRIEEMKPNISHALIGAGASVFALTIIVWRVLRRRRYGGQHGNT
jgi:sugar lactone lactonase YvrE